MSKIKNIFTLTLGQGFNTLINLLFLPYLARSMSYADYGTYGQTLLVVDIAKTFLLLGLSQMIFVWLADKNKNKESTISNNLFAGIFAGLIGILFFYFSKSFFANQFDNTALEGLILIYSLSIVFQLPVLGFNSVLIFNQKIKKNIQVIIFGNIFKIILVLISIQIYHSLILVMYSLVAASVFQFILALFFNKEYIKPKLISLKQIVEQIKVGFPLGITGVIGIALLTTDGFMVSKMLGVKEYAIYRNGAIEVPFISTIYGSIAAIILPEVSKLFSAGKYTEIVELKRKVITNTAMIIYPIMLFLIFFNKEIITLYLGNKYQASGIIFAVFTLSLLIRVNNYSDVLISAKKSKVILYSYSTAFAVNLVLNYILIKQIGILGASISTIISLFVLAGIQLQITVNILSVNIIDLFDLKKIVIMLFLSSIMLFLLSFIKLLDNNLIVILLSFVLYFIIVYFVLLKYKLMEIRIISGILPNRLSKLLKI